MTASIEELNTQLAATQARAEYVARVWGRDTAQVRPAAGESPMQYRKRMLEKFRPLSAAWKDANVSSIADPKLLAIAEKQIFADAERAARDPRNFERGTLREVIEPDRAGRRISKFIGHEGTCWDRFGLPLLKVAALKTGGR
jgi:hypothetical protein